jgi:hypothetical protein
LGLIPFVFVAIAIVAIVVTVASFFSGRVASKDG